MVLHSKVAVEQVKLVASGPFSQTSLGGFVALEAFVSKVLAMCHSGESLVQLNLTRCVQFVRDRSWKDIKSAVAVSVVFALSLQLSFQTHPPIAGTWICVRNASIGQWQ
jgi:hypothetical protein